MVSALTDRLFSGYSSSETNSSGGGRGGRRGSSSNEDNAKVSGGGGTTSGGYSADHELSAQGTPPPFYIDLMSRHRKRHYYQDHLYANGGTRGANDSSSPEDQKAKQELQYLAHMARREVARGGLDCDEGEATNSKKPRLLGMDESIDMSHVSLVHSKDYFAPPRKPGSESAWNMTHMMSPDLCMSTLQSIIKSCSDHYQGPAISQTSATSAAAATTDANNTHDGTIANNASETECDNSDLASSTSSVTEGDSDEVGSGEESTKAAISMGQALTLSKQPRVIVIADAPYTIVHCNAAFLEMTGVASSKVLGRSLVETLDEQTLDVGDDFWELHHTDLHFRCSTSMAARGTPSVTCRTRLSPIGAQLDNVTHISIELDPPRQVQESNCRSSSSPILMTSATEEPPVKVVA